MKKIYIVRIKIELEENNEDEYYEKEKWFELFEYKDKKCSWRIKKNGEIDFILGNYEDRYEALADGKILYFNILYEVHRSDCRFKLGEANYMTKMYHEDRGYTLEEFIGNEEWFFNTKEDSSNFLGLGVYEIDKEIDEYDEYEKILMREITVVTDEPFPFLEKIKKMDANYKYSKKSQEIFNLIRLAEQADKKTAILLLCQALETMGENKKRPQKEINVLDECINLIDKSDLTNQQKEPLKNMLSRAKSISNKNKSKNLIGKYSLYEYKQFDKMKIFNEAYRIRGKITHGEKVDYIDAFRCGRYLKIMVLDILKEWSKDNTKN